MPEAERYQHYEVLRREDGRLWELGRGSMGITYKAYDTNLRCTVALKVINSAYLRNDTARERFLREARAAAALRHPNVASVFNLGMDQGDWFYVMEFIDGENVEACVRRKGPLEPFEALNITLQVTRALAAAEKQHLVHRDLKPSNLMLVDQDGEQIVKVIDFGLAKKSKDAGEDTAALTVSGFVGTPHFASPEQVEEVDLDLRSDIYSLGATLFFMLSGKAPFTGSVGQVMSQHLYKPIDLEPLSYLPPSVVSLLASMLEKNRDRRPQTPRELQNAIVRCLEDLRGAATHSPVTTPAVATGALSPETLFSRYRIVEELRDSPHARYLIAEDLRRERLVNLYILNRAFLGDPQWLGALKRAVSMVQNRPHALLRTIYSLELTGEFGFLIEEHVSGPSLLDLLRARSVLSAPEVALLLRTLAPLAEHIGTFGLEHVELSLSGIQLVKLGPGKSEFQPDLLRRPLTAWEKFELKVSPLDWSFAPFSAGTLTAEDSGSQSIAGIILHGSPVRSLSLLAYELLGAQRESAELRRPYKPVAALTEEGNAVLRRGLADEYTSATKFAAEIAAAVEASGVLPEPQEIAVLLIQVEPPGATILLDGNAPQVPPNTFTHVSFGPHQLLVSLHGYESTTQSLQVSRGMSPEIFVRLREVTKIAHLSVKTDPPGALVLLDGQPPQNAPDTFTNVNFGIHHLEATLPNYHPIKKDIQVRKGTPPELNLALKPIKKISLMGKVLRLAAILTILVCLGIGGYWIYRKNNEVDVLSVRSSPPGAVVLLDGKPAEQPANTFKEIPFGIHQLTATLDGYEPVKREISLVRGIKEIHLELKKLPELEALTVATNPPGASILLDGKPPSAANTFSHVPFGKHLLTATANGFLPIKQEIQVYADSPPEIRLTLTEIPEIATLTVQTDPPGASILLDGKAPQNPNAFSHVSFGKHQLTATLDNYEPVQQEIDVSRGMTPEIRLKLKEIKEIPALSVSSDPPGASILLDGKPPQNANTFAHVSFGKHQLTATLNNYEPVQQEIDVSRGMTPEIRLKLKEIKEIPALSVTSDPPGASILLDGKPPESSNTFTHVSLGVHRLTATLENYEQATQDVEITAGMKPEIQLKLKKTDPLIALLSESKKYSEGSPEQVEAYVRLVRYLQKSGAADSEQYLKELGQIVQRLRTRVPPIAKDQFIFSYKQSIQEAANLNVIPAIVWLAEQERGQAAYDLFLRAANMDDSYAMGIVGRLHLYKGTLSDDEAAFAWLKRAYEAANPSLEAGAYLAFCYLNGRGTKKDVEQGKKLTMELANQNVVFAMTQAGVVLATEAQGKREEAAANSNPRTRKQLSADADDLDLQARHWWERAAEKNDWNASARLGLFYQEGLGGLKKSDDQAEKLYLDGIKHENNLSKFYYAQFLLEKKPDRRSDAVDLMSQAATAGIPSAKKWCKENNVNYTDSTTDNDNR